MEDSSIQLPETLQENLFNTSYILIQNYTTHTSEIPNNLFPNVSDLQVPKLSLHPLDTQKLPYQNSVSFDIFQFIQMDRLDVCFVFFLLRGEGYEIFISRILFSHKSLAQTPKSLAKEPPAVDQNHSLLRGSGYLVTGYM